MRTPDGLLVAVHPAAGPALLPEEFPLLAAVLAGQVGAADASACPPDGPEARLLRVLGTPALLALPLGSGPVGIALLLDAQLPALSEARLAVACEQALAIGGALPDALACRDLWNHLTEGALWLDGEGRLLDANPIGRSLLDGEGLEAWEARLTSVDGRPLANGLRPSARARRGEAFRSWEVMGRSPSGPPRFYRLSGAPMGRRFACWIEDITAYKQREKELAALCALTATSYETPVELLTRVLESILALTHLESGLLLYHGSGMAPTGTAIGLAPGVLEAVNGFDDRHGMDALYAVLAGAEPPERSDSDALLATFEGILERWVVLPLQSGNRVMGVLVLANAEYHQLSDNMSLLLSTIVHHLLLSMELHQALGSMEALVAERTAALVESHRQLEQKVAELKRVDQFKTDFLSNVSHELRTPLCGIIGYGEFLAEGVYGELGPEQQEVLSQLVTNSYQLMELINNLLDLSRIDAGKLLLYREPIELPVLIEQAVGKVRPQALKKGLALRISVADEVLVHVDPARIVQVLVNLLSNAIKFTSEGGTVSVNVEAAGDVATVRVRDTGIGIAPEVLPRLFVRFSQADSSTTRQFGGTGLGLAISRELIELHHQQIWGESTPGAGSTFFFTLPLWKPAAEPIATKS